MNSNIDHDNNSDVKLDERILKQLQEYINQHYKAGDQHDKAHLVYRVEKYDLVTPVQNFIFDGSQFEYNLEKKLEKTEKSYSEMLCKMIDDRGMTDSECYKKANVTKSTFNKIKNESNYHAGKMTIIALGLALHLTRSEMDALLKRAGYAFSDASKADLIVECFMQNDIYDIFTINEYLNHFGQKLLGSVSE